MADIENQLDNIEVAVENMEKVAQGKELTDSQVRRIGSALTNLAVYLKNNKGLGIPIVLVCAITVLALRVFNKI